MGIEASPQVRPDEPRPSAGRRAAAAAGLLAAAGALALVVAGLFNSPLRLGLALVALCVALMAAWTALVNHGARRVLAGAVAVVALIGLVALFDLRSIVRISLVVGLVLISAAAARVALAHDLAPAAFESRKVGPAQHGVLLMNPWSGGGKVERFDLEAEARRRGDHAGRPAPGRRPARARRAGRRRRRRCDRHGRGRRVTGTGRRRGPPS